MPADRRRAVAPCRGADARALPAPQAIRPTNSERFRHPLALLRLATFVRDAADVARAGRKAKWPLAVVGPDDGSGFCCVMGIRHKQLPRQPQARAARRAAPLPLALRQRVVSPPNQAN